MLHHNLHTPKEIVTQSLDRFGKLQTNKHIQRTERRIGYTLHGIFCSWSCARAYGNVHHPSLRAFIGSWIYRILIALANVAKASGLLPKNYHVRNALTAPHFSVLRKFGGSMSIEKFRRIGELDNNNIFSLLPSWLNIVPAGMLASEIPNDVVLFRENYNERQLNKTKAIPRPRKVPLGRVVRSNKRRRRNRILETITPQ